MSQPLVLERWTGPVADNDPHANFKREVAAGALVDPLPTLQNLADYVAFFNDPALRVFSLTAAVCERAAHIRAIDKFKPLDALHLAAAVENGCGLFLTNDAQLRRFPGITVEVLT